MRIPILLAAATLALSPFTEVDADVYRSTDGGETWTLVGLPDTTVTELQFHPTDGVLIARAGDRLYRSDAAGGTWQRLDDGSLRSFTTVGPRYYGTPAPGLVVDSLVIAPGSPSVFYAIGQDGGGSALMRSENGGVSWSAVDSFPLEYAHCLALNADGQSLFVCGYANETAHPMGWTVKSQDGGLTWETVACCYTADADPWLIVADPDDPLVMYAGVWGDATPSGDGMFRSVDGGSSWQQLGGVLLDFENGRHRRPVFNDFVFDPLDTTTLYATTSYGLGKLTQRGDRSALLDIDRVRRVAVHPVTPATVYAAKSALADDEPVLWRSTDGGASWGVHSNDLDGLTVNRLVIDPGDPSRMYAATAAVPGNASAPTPDDGDTDPGTGTDPTPAPAPDDDDTDGATDSDSDPAPAPTPAPAPDSGSDDDADTDTGGTDTSAPTTPNPSPAPAPAASSGGGGHGGLLLALLPLLARPSRWGQC